MTSKAHNKKRNSLLMYEFLVRTISRSIVENDKKKSAVALKILKRHFKPGTELYREFRLLNSLAKTTVSSEHVAASILKEAKNAASSIDYGKLDREKSLLVRSINHGINDDDFYDQHVNEYRTYATIQTLLNEWSSTDRDISKMATYEDHLMRHLVTPKEDNSATITNESSGTTRLLMKVMSKKLNEKYGDSLNDHQKSLIKSYAYSTASSDQTSIKMKLNEIKTELIDLIDSYVSSPENDAQYIKGKLTETKTAILSEDVNGVDDEMVTRFMLYSKLSDELKTKE